MSAHSQRTNMGLRLAQQVQVQLDKSQVALRAERARVRELEAAIAAHRVGVLERDEWLDRELWAHLPKAKRKARR